MKLNLLAGNSLYSENIEVKPLYLREIAKIGYTEYSQYLGLLTLDKEKVIGGNRELEQFSLLEIIVLSENLELISLFGEALCFFLKQDSENLLVSANGFIFGGRDWEQSIEDCFIINGSNFNDIVQIIKYQNCLTSSSQPIEDAVDEKVRRYQEKLRKAQEKVQEAKKSNGIEMDFSDVVSAVSTKSNTYNKQNIWDLTVYQLYDEYKRLEAISSYEVSIMAMINGAKIDDLKHWSSRIE